MRQSRKSLLPSNPPTQLHVAAAFPGVLPRTQSQQAARDMTVRVGTGGPTTGDHKAAGLTWAGRLRTG